MGCKINYWYCKYCDSDFDLDDDGGEIYHYGCSHPKNDGDCEHENKFDNDETYCEFAEFDN